MLSIGVIGLGIMGRRMLGSLTTHPGFRVAGAWDPSADARTIFATTYPGIPLLESAADLIGLLGLDAVYIASPPRSHIEHLDRAFDAGRAALCEKPLSVDAGQSRRLVARATAEGQRAAVNFPFASSIGVTALLADLAALGPIRSIDVEVGFAAWPRQWQEAAAPWLGRRGEGGFVREVVSHFLFLARRLGGPLTVLDGHVAYPSDGETAETALEARLTAGEVPLRLTGGVGGWHTEIDENTCVIEAAGGALRIRDWIGVERRMAAGWVPLDLGEGDLRQRAAALQLDGLAALIEGRPHHLPTLSEALDVQVTVETLLSSGAGMPTV
ncbi:MAG TPA: Gfo/Idh/MocA family oxidoreductase [Stellaceae bacterium]|nr:Gfo/Idh/MocA family oxidoreductase [Stellaceae bacterium]